MTKNLWGEIPKKQEVRSPYSILESQAKVLTQLTNGVLEGVVERTFSSENIICANLCIRVPALNNYQYLITQIQYSLEFYPLFIIDSAGAASKIECECEASFLTALEDILSSDATKEIIAGLLAEIQ